MVLLSGKVLSHSIGRRGVIEWEGAVSLNRKVWCY